MLRIILTLLSFIYCRASDFSSKPRSVNLFYLLIFSVDYFLSEPFDCLELLEFLECSESISSLFLQLSWLYEPFEDSSLCFNKARSIKLIFFCYFAWLGLEGLRDCYFTLIAIVFSFGFFSLLKDPPEPFVLLERGGLEEGGLKLFWEGALS